MLPSVLAHIGGKKGTGMYQVCGGCMATAIVLTDMPTIPLLAEFFCISVFFPPFRAELWKFRFFHEFL